jgi:hypothetical protein
VGAGLGEWVTQDFPYRLDIGTHGVDAEVHFSLHDGRQVELAVTEHRRTPGRHIDLLAPLGVGIERPTFLPYFVMFGIDLVRRGGTDVTMRIAGADRELERIPVPIPYSGRLCYLARYCDEPFIMRINPAGPRGRSIPRRAVAVASAWPSSSARAMRSSRACPSRRPVTRPGWSSTRPCPTWRRWPTVPPATVASPSAATTCR